MGGSYSTNEREEKFILILVVNLKERGHMEDLGIHRIIILKCIIKKLYYTVLYCHNLRKQTSNKDSVLGSSHLTVERNFEELVDRIGST
jgi:hypothetical protein